MADASKRMRWARDKETQDRILYYLFEKAVAVRGDVNASADELALADRVYSQSVNLFAVAMLCAANATIGAALDAGNAVAESDIQWVVQTGQWAALVAAGV